MERDKTRVAVSTYINTIGTELLQASFNRFNDIGSAVVTVVGGVLDLGGQSKSSVLPVGSSSVCFLCASDVDACSVYFVVSSALKDVERLAKGLLVKDAGSLGLIWAKGHEAQDDAITDLIGDKRHYEWITVLA